MHTPAKILGLLALAGTIVPPALFMGSALGIDAVKAIMFVSSIVWFVAAPFWMKVE